MAVKGFGGLGESVKKWKFLVKIFFPENDGLGSKKLWKMISAYVKADMM